MKQHLHVAIGPVQGFLTRSRRTRDLWGSSYLLSFLAAQAMRGARNERGVIVRPSVDTDPMLGWVEGRREGAAPTLGSLPNQFTVELEDGDAPTVAAEAERYLRAAWRETCQAVWERYVAHASTRGNGTETIWKRQTEGFWEVVWVAGAPDEHDLLARRKRWRTHALPEESGNKCTVMPDLQEISGYVRATDRAQQDAFWNAVRARTGELDLRENERLCAIALVKRLFPRVSQEALGWSIDVAHWPSTVDVAAVPWSLRIIDAARERGESFATEVLAATDRGRTGGVSSLVHGRHHEAESFLTLDSNWFHRPFLANPRLALLPDENTRASLLAQLDALTATEGSPPIYFALLLADGDRLGVLTRISLHLGAARPLGRAAT